MIMTFFVKSMRPYRKHLVFVLITSATGLLIVNILKNTTHIYTPWSLNIFGGAKPYIRIFDAVPFGSSVGHAFPGGYSSAGFAFISVYFVLSAMNIRLQGVSKMQITFKDKARADEKAEPTWEYVSILRRLATP
jgi:membrane-associated PAP2 superfamily phosphatase